MAQQLETLTQTCVRLVYNGAARCFRETVYPEGHVWGPVWRAYDQQSCVQCGEPREAT